MAQELLGKARHRIGRLGERWRPALRRKLRPIGPGNMQPGPAPLEEPDEARGPEPPRPRKAGTSTKASAKKKTPDGKPAKRAAAKKAPAAADADGEGPAKRDLYERARKLDIPGRSKMSKQELADAISKAEESGSRR
ncbi:hypothetical protein GCM10010411_27260 [Actinomadura fulvescens]|uniref:Rho termination factor-like N-terminal domain-containing protein n=1 Tax=Actinomadura fulvescens TaxID=46160 RepID=A0ABP6C0V8_9ACTN